MLDRTENLTVRLRPSERRLLEQAAAAKEERLTVYVRDSVLALARETVSQASGSDQRMVAVG